MITREDLLKSSEYWIETIQNKIYSDLAEYIEDNKIQGKDIAESLGISKGRVSQILSGENLNFRLDTLVRLCLTINKVPDFHLIDVDNFIKEDLLSSSNIVFEKTQVSQSLLPQSLMYNTIAKNMSYFKVTDEFFNANVVEDVKEEYSTSLIAA
jgi:predicted XRE-type DNA-binding protein